jgi:hypothetical protein
MQLSFELAADQAEKLRHEAERLGVAPVELARAAVSDLLATPDETFQAAAERVLRKNGVLYRRLAG